VKLLKWILNRWKEQPRRVRDPQVLGSIVKILKGQYPSEEVRKHFRIGGKENEQITCFERAFMCLLLLRTYADLLYGIKKMLRIIPEDGKKFKKFDTTLVERYVIIKTIVLFVCLCLPMSQCPISMKLIGYFIC